MKIIDCIQGSPEWYSARAGIPSASNFDKIVCLDGKVSKQRTKYMYQLAGEAITGRPEETYQSAAMERGKIIEDEARQLYTLVKGLEVNQVGFCLADGYGASPDGMIAGDGLLELKCPLISTHVGYLLDNKVPSEYFQQTQGQLLVTDRAWVDFMSYYPGIKPLIIRITRDEKFITILRAELVVFCNELKEVIQKIR